MIDIRYPIGKFDMGTKVTRELVTTWIKEIEDAPANLRRAVEGLEDWQLDTPYRDGGWTPRQIVHHIADSNMNTYIRFKLTMTENEPTVKTYNETEWSKLVDARTALVGSSLEILEGLHIRWAIFLRSLSEKDLSRRFIHPDSGPIPLSVNIGAYAWHCRHHTEQIMGLRERMDWS